MTTELIKVDAKEYGIEESKAADIAAQFKPMLDKMIELETEYNEVIALPIESAGPQAKSLRLKYVKVRTGTENIHKDQKAFYLAAGRFVDGWKNAQLFAAQGIESKLEQIENYAINLENERIERLRTEREKILAKYEVDTSGIGLGRMTQQVFDNFLLGVKTAYENRIEAERIAEEQRQAAIEAERLRIENQRIENERLKKEAEEREAVLAQERKKADEERKAAEAKLKAEKDEAARLAKIEADKQAAILAKQRKEAEEKLAAEKEIARKLAAELQAKKDAEEKERKRIAKIESDRISAEKKAAKAPVKQRLITAVSSLTIVLPESEITASLLEKFEAYKKWALIQIDEL
jgi:hypothetical protein